MNILKKFFSVEEEMENESKELQRSIDELLLGEEEITGIKPTKKTEPQNFIGDFDITKFNKVDEKIVHGVENPTVIKALYVPETENRRIEQVRSIEDSLPMSGKGLSIEQKKEILKNSLIIMIERPIKSDELDFIGNSRINGKPIYRYIGKDFLSFRTKYENYEFDEVFYNPGFGIS